MKKAVLIPDSFKGTISSKRICEIIGRKIYKYFPDCEVVSIPVADGGEGSVDCFLEAVNGDKVTAQVQDPFGDEMTAYYAILPDSDSAVIEMAVCAGLPLAEGRENPAVTSTYGVGQLIIDAAKRGCRKIIMCLGGSATNDLGCGAAAAAGIKFFDRDGNEFIPVGGTLKDIAKVDLSGKNKILDGVEFVTMCDIDNPLYGETGAAYIFAPQKGADEKCVKMLDEGLRSAAKVINEAVETEIDSIAGGGAAGGMGAGMQAFFGSSLQMGIETILDTVDFDSMIDGANVIFTGEGRFDSQSLRGKVVIGVSKRAKEKGVPVVVIAGDYDKKLDAAYENGVSAVFSTNRVAKDFSVIKGESVKNLELAADNILRLISIFDK